MKNTIIRTISGICFLGVMLGGFLIHPYAFAALHVLIIAGMLAEFFNMSMGKRYPLQRILAILFGCGLFLSFFAFLGYKMPKHFLALNGIPILAILISTLYLKDKEDLRDLAFIFMGLLYIVPSVITAIALVFKTEDGNFSGMLLLAFFCIIWCSDVGAYVFGHLFGQNGKKLFPSVSPKKSWAGFWGGLVLAVAAGVVLYFTGLFKFSLLHSIIISVIMDIAGVYGDLFESVWKRKFGFKDSGNIIPGHGGVLDRFDSALFAIPTGLAYLLLFGLL